MLVGMSEGGRPTDVRPKYRPGPRRHMPQSPPGIPITQAARWLSYLVPTVEPVVNSGFSDLAGCALGEVANRRPTLWPPGGFSFRNRAMSFCGQTTQPVLVRSKPIFLLRTCSVSAKISSDDTRPFTITLMVIRAIFKSTHNDAVRTYHSSNFSLSSLVTSLAPFTCAHPLIPGRTESLTDVFQG